MAVVTPQDPMTWKADAGAEALTRSVCLQAALKGAVSLCKRHSRDAAPAAAQELWFTVLQRYVALLRRLRQMARQQDANSATPEQAAAQVLKHRLQRMLAPP